jgi:large subunit ribosomal protein L31e
MAEKKETKKVANEREYVIPLREKIRVVPRYKKTNKAIKTVKEFLARHMKIRDRDLNKIKLDTYLNEFLWNRGIKNPPHKVKVKAVKEGDIVKAELVDYPKKLKVKKEREEKLQKKSEEVKKKKAAEKKEEPKESEEKKEEEKEKKAAVVEAGKEMEKAQHKQTKHTAKKQERASTAQKRSLQR